MKAKEKKGQKKHQANVPDNLVSSKNMKKSSQVESAESIVSRGDAPSGDQSKEEMVNGDSNSAHHYHATIDDEEWLMLA